MLRFIIRRFLLMLIVMAAVVVLVVTLSRVQGDPRVMYLAANTTPEQWDAWGRKMGLDRPVATAWWISFFPGIGMFLTVMALNFIGDWFRDRLDPKLRHT